MGRMESAIAGVQERDKWRKRLEALEKTLGELLERRRRIETRLQRVHRELIKLEKTAREFVEIHGGSVPSGVRPSFGSGGPVLR
jgi:predicted  nucleic acid-binding Zn-ribbon protein